ncbi:glycosyltransferase family 2 protein [Acinetobacter sp. SAAs474]|uniref:glycosyltransferase family 2 protein n=1 Tax=Acinetobacter sp. SAAs474 TaxID=3036710 RepID=UPI00293447CD|nr:glycosyltransferase family 2 protein [Acinetobacter sp. SAAs474]WOE39090.1 glycosyltransferase family 2 protein [Acinetobacter sp. SAAs474]
MDTIQPLVTVYIPTYNRLELLKRAVKSVQEQTYTNLEIIIVDDCSTDGTQEYLIQLASQDQRIRYFFKEKNSGACVSRNIAIKNATGEFITGLDDDDYFLKNRIKEFILAWGNKKETTKVLYSLYLRKTETGLTKKVYKLKKVLMKKEINAKDLIYYFYLGNQIFTLTSLFKKIYLMKILSHGKILNVIIDF